MALHSLRQSMSNKKGKDLYDTRNLGAPPGPDFFIFIGPRCPWGPIYGSGCLSLTHSKTFVKLMQVMQVMQVIQVTQVIDSLQVIDSIQRR